jgi:phosphinothricin acetyltransferase
MNIRYAQESDLEAIVAIYNETVASRMVTADTQPVTVESRRAWFASHNASSPIFVYYDENKVLGWLSYKDFYGRPAYQKCKEISIYITQKARGQGLGTILLEFAQSHAREIGLKVLLGFVFSHNLPSIKLFEQQGFTVWGEFPEVAEMDDQTYSLTILGKHL